MRSDPTQVKGRALVVSRELVKAVRRQSPLVVLLEDLQWADAASWEYLMEVFLGESGGGAAEWPVHPGSSPPGLAPTAGTGGTVQDLSAG